MRVRRAEGFSDIGREAWNALCTGSTTNTVFQTHEWHVAWWEAYGGDSELYLLVVEEEAQLVGIAPMMIPQRDGGKRVLVFVGDYRSDYLDFIYDGKVPGVPQAIVEYLSTHREYWDRIEINKIPERSATHVHLESAAENNGLYCVITGTVACPTLVIKDNAAAVEAVRNKKKLRYYRKYFLEKPGYSIRHLTSCEEIEKHIEDFFKQHVERWAGTPTPSIFLEDKSKTFYMKLLSSMCDKGWIAFTVLESEGVALAYHFGFLYGNAFVVYKPTYNPLLAKHSPGQVLLRELLEYAVSRECDEFDFTVGDEPYKRRFASEVRRNISYSILRTKRNLLALRFRIGLKRRLEGNSLGRRLVNFRKRVASHSLPRLHETVLRYGVYGWIRRAAGMLFRRFIFNYNRVLYFEMPEGVVAEKQIELKVDDVIFREGTISDLIRFDYPESPLLKQEFLHSWCKNLEAGDKCFIAEIGGEVAATIWVRTRDYTYISEAETYVALDDKPACFFYAWTLPKFRGKGMLTFLYSRALEHYRDKRKIAYLYETNIGSMRAALRLGNFRLIRIYYLLNIFGLKWRWSKPHTGSQPNL